MIFLPMLMFVLSAISSDSFHYPEERLYTDMDQGYAQYGAPSLHKTGKYALTFDDGPHYSLTPTILDHLKSYNVKATFFIITSLVNEKTFPIIKRILDEGHLLANHGLKHDNSNTLSQAEWKSQVKESFIDLAKFYQRAGHPLNKFYYRFPYAAYGKSKNYHHLNALKEISRELLGDNCIHFTFWDIDSGDWIPKMSALDVFNNLKATHEGGAFFTYKTVRNTQGRTTQVKVPTRLDHPSSGGVILQHDIQSSSVEGTKLFLNYAQENHLEIVRLDDVEEFKITKKCELKRN